LDRNYGTVNALETLINYTFKDPSLLEQALTHSSARHERGLVFDNQRMEYLGDAVLGFLTAAYLYHHHPDLSEGPLTTWRSAVTSTAPLAAIARTLHLGSAIILGRGEESSGGREKENNLADALEALLGAVYLDGGPAAAETVFRHVFIPVLGQIREQAVDNPKGRLQEWAQQHALPCPVYEVVEESGPPHLRWYSVRARLNAEHQSLGQGNSKRSAETEAARNLLLKIGTLNP
jgi:ribonuclease-3